MIERRRRLRCTGCSQPIELPQKETEPWQSPWPIAVVCRHCARQADYSIGDIKSEEVERPERGTQVDQLWMVTFQCAYLDCQKRKEVYISCEHFMDLSEVERLVLLSKTPITCEAGHQLRTLNVHSVSLVGAI